MSNKDRLMPKQTKQETFLHERIQKMRDEFELRMLNIVAQVRAVAIAANVDPAAFIEAFHDQKGQNEWFKKQSEHEAKKVAELKAKHEEQIAKDSEFKKELEDKLDPNLKNFIDEQAIMREIIEEPGDKII